MSLTIFLVLGLCSGIGAALTSYLGYVALAGILSGVTASIAIVLAFVIARKQAKESNALYTAVDTIDDGVNGLTTGVGELSEANERIYVLTLSIAERDSAEDYSAQVDEVAEESASNDAEEPEYAEGAIDALRERGSSLTSESADWKKKIPEPPVRGNHGWFVEPKSGEPVERWYVRKARGWTIRKAMPRDFLNALERQEGVSPQTIKHDFQLKDHGLAAWYARTYSGDLWKVWISNRNREAGIQTERALEDSESR